MSTWIVIAHRDETSVFGEGHVPSKDTDGFMWTGSVFAAVHEAERLTKRLAMANVHYEPMSLDKAICYFSELAAHGKCDFSVLGTMQTFASKN